MISYGLLSFSPLPLPYVDSQSPIFYPPTLAFAKAGAAPGTTGGVDPVFLEPLPRPHCRQTPPQGHRNGSRAPHGRSNGFFYRLPFAKPQTLQTFQLLQKFAQLRREKAPHGRSNGSTTRPPQWLKSTPRPQQWLLLWAAVCEASNPPNLPTPPKVCPNSAGKRHPTAAAMASFIGVQGCHLPGLKRSKRSTPSTSPPSSAGKRYPNKPNTRHSRMQNAQLRTQASVVRACKPAVCQASNP